MNILDQSCRRTGPYQGKLRPHLSSVNRIRLYLDRVEKAIQSGEKYDALADLAEVNEISRRLWDIVSKV